MGKKDGYCYENREISWLSFNERVLQEAADRRLPLFERLNFLAIYSSNLDEFFRVRVASMRSLMRLKRKSINKLDFNPGRLVKQITQIVTQQQERFGAILGNELLPALKEEGIHLLTEREVDEDQAAFLRSFFRETVQPLLQPAPLEDVGSAFFVKNRSIYLVTEFWGEEEYEPEYRLLEVPGSLNRFVELPGAPPDRYVMFLDDVIRFNLDAIYGRREIGGTYAIKLSRDADLHLEDEFSGTLVEMIEKSLNKRETGAPSRLLYDLNMPFALAVKIKKNLDLKNEDMVLGGRYHNLNDFFSFPRFGKSHLVNAPMPPHAHPRLSRAPSIFDAVAGADQLMHFPYQSYEPVIRFFEEAAEDDRVEEICISLYRVARNSAITKALIRARENGKAVTAFVEVKARFDEESNLYWVDQMHQAGITVLYSIPEMETFKVHAKIAMVVRRERGERVRYCYLGTGNFNEKTARIYADEALLTADERLAKDVEQVFHFLRTRETPSFEHLLVAPFTLRSSFNALIDKEIEEAKAGREAWMVLKMNSLEDEKIIRRLYKASNAGVNIEMIVRGICRLVPGVEGQSENIHVISIVDRFLEHGRAYVFHHGGERKMYLASADWMTRNLDRRVEVAFPVYDEAHRQTLMKMLKTQQSDNQKARLIDQAQSNPYVRNDGPPVRAQYTLYDAYKV